MKRGWLGLALAGLLVLLIGSGSSEVVAQEGEAPYLYYYSQTHNGFVIERADGTDSRILAQGVMGADEELSGGPAWSPSGQWFAWGYGYRDPETDTYINQYQVVSSDGQRTVSVLDGLQDYTMLWSPVDDLLFLYRSSYIRQDGAAYPYHRVAAALIIDPEQDLILSQLTIETDDIYRVSVYGEWTPDGQAGVIHYGIYDGGDVPQWLQGFGVVMVTGQTINYPFRPDVELVSDFEAPWMLYRADDQTFVTKNIITGEVRQLVSSDAGIANLRWIDATHGLVLTNPSSCIGYGTVDCPLTIWRMTPQGGEPLLEGVYAVSPVYQLTDGASVVYIVTQAGQWYRLDTADGMLDPLAVDVDVDTSNPHSISWKSKSTIIIWNPNSDEGTYYQLDTSATQHLCNPELRHQGLSVSPDGCYQASLFDGTVVYDAVQQETVHIPPDSRSSWAAFYDGEIFWDAGSQWLITTKNAAEAGGGAGPRWVGVASRDGAVVRELTQCWLSAVCVGWLPTQVDEDELAPVQELPAIYTLPTVRYRGSQWYRAVVWRPDSQQLLVVPRGSSPTIFLDVPSLAATQLDLSLGEYEGVEWQQDATGAYTPVPIRVSAADRTVPSDIAERYEIRDSGVIWDRVLNQAVFVSPRGHPWWDSYYQLTILNDQLWALTSRSGETYIVNRTTWEAVARLPGVTSIALSPDGRWLAGAVSWEVWLWDMTTLIGGD